MKTTSQLSKAIQDLHDIKMEGIRKAARAKDNDTKLMCAAMFIVLIASIFLF